MTYMDFLLSKFGYDDLFKIFRIYLLIAEDSEELEDLFMVESLLKELWKMENEE